MSYQPEYLIDQLDQSLQSGISSELKDQLQREEGMAREWQFLQIAVEAIRESGLNDQVAAIRKTYQAENRTASRPALVRNMYRMTMRVAAVIVLLVVATGIYKYASVNASDVYDRYYTSYQFGTSRGANGSDQLEKAYREKKWQEVIAQFNGLETRTNKTYFLTGMAQMELKKPGEAIPMFKQVIDNNKTSGENYFQDEAEYYLAMSYLASQDVKNALPILEKIRDDKNHLYNGPVSQIPGIDLKIIQLKSGK